MRHLFNAQIYKLGINWCVDVPEHITSLMEAKKGYIKIQGHINGFFFKHTLVPVKNAPYRLYVNGIMMKGGKTALGEVAAFEIEQDTDVDVEKEYPVPEKLAHALYSHGLEENFDALSAYRRKEILKYLNKVKREETFLKNLEKLLMQLKDGVKDVRIP